APALRHLWSELVDGDLRGELVVDAELAGVGGVLAGDLDAGYGVLDVQVAAGLGAVAVDGEIVADRRLDDEAVQGGAEHGVVVEAVDQARIPARLVGLEAVDHALVQIGGTDAPDLAGE